MTIAGATTVRRAPVLRAAAVAAAAGRRRRGGGRARRASRRRAALARRRRPSCGPARRRWRSRRCANSAAPKHCGSCWRAARRRRPADALLCTALALVLARRRCALRGVHAGRPGGGSGQARHRHARPGQLHQRLPAPLPARARRAGGRDRREIRSRSGTIRAGGSTRLQAGPSARLAAHPGGQQHAAADDAAGQRAETAVAPYLASAGGRGHRRDAGGRARRGAGPAAARARHPGFDDGRVCRCRMPPRNWPRRCCCDGLGPRAASAAAHARCVRRARRQDGAPAGAGATPRSPRWTSTRRAASASTKRCAASACRPDVLAADAAQPCALVGRPSLRRHPARRALHRIGHRAPPPRRALAAPRKRHRATRGACRRACWRRCGRCCEPGGRLLYCTCSVFRAEGEAQIQTFVAHNTDAVLRPAPGHLLPQSGAKAQWRPGQSGG